MAVGGNVDYIEEELTIVTSPNENIDDSYTNTTSSTHSELEEPSIPRFPGNKLTLVLIGETGVGKSTLTNAFLGETINSKAVITTGPNPTQHKPYQEHTGNIDGIDIVVYDTRGLSDPTNPLSNNQIIKKFQEVVQTCENGAYLVLVCQEMKGKANNFFEDFTKLLAGCFGKNTDEIWKRCILVLMKANQYGESDEDDKKIEAELKTEMEAIMEQWSEKFYKSLIKHGVREDIIKEIPVCPTGNKRHTKLFTTNNWKDELLDKCESQVYTSYVSKYQMAGGMKKSRILQTLTGAQSMFEKAIEFGTEGGGHIGRSIGSKIYCGDAGYRIGSFIGRQLGEMYYNKLVLTYEKKEIAHKEEQS